MCRIQEIFDAALKVDGERRREFLREACQGDAELLAEVEELLGFDAKGDCEKFLEHHHADLTLSRFDPVEEPLVGRCIGCYEILEEIGRGGMGVVYKARQPSIDRPVALKMILADGLVDSRARQRFLDEARVLGLVEHPNIVRVHDAGEHEGRLYFVMEYVEGGSLAVMLTQSRLSPVDAARLLEKLARAVHAAHDRLVIHRDLKPANVLLSIDGEPRVADFGLARRLDHLGQTKSREVLGSPYYMAPEQATCRTDEIGPGTDIYALGAILYECLIGHPPFQASTTFEALSKVINDEPKPPRHLRADVPRDLETVCLKCLRKDPRKRYARADELAEDLRRFLAGDPVQARPVSRLERAGHWAKHRPALVAVYGLLTIVALLGVLGGGAAWLWQRAESARDQAELSREEATEARDQARREKSQTEAALLREGEAKRLETEARQQEAAAREELDQILYLRRVSLAAVELRNLEIIRARRLLEECPPLRRDWEWYFLHQLTRVESYSIKGHTGVVGTVAYSPEGNYIVTASNDKTIRGWEARTGKAFFRFDAGRSVIALACSPDGKQIASAGHDQTVTFWDMQTRKATFTLTGHGGRVGAVAYSPDGNRLVTGSSDSKVKVWDPRTGKIVSTFDWHSGEVQAVTYSPDGILLASAALDKTVRLLNTETHVVRQHNVAGNARSLAFSPDGHRLAIGRDDLLITVWDIHKDQVVLNLKGHTGQLRVVRYSPDGRFIASGALDGAVKVWDAIEGKLVVNLKGHAKPVLSLVYSPDGSRIVSTDEGGTVKCWDLTLTQDPPILKCRGGTVWGLAYSPDGRRLIVGTAGQSIQVWDAGTRKKSRFYDENTKGIRALACSPDGKQIARASTSPTDKVIVVDTQTGETVSTFEGHSDGVLAVTYSPDGTKVATGSHDQLVKVWDPNTGKEILTLRGHSHQVYAVAYSPDGTRIASASGTTIHLWDAFNGKQVGDLRGHSDRIVAIMYSPDGKYLASGSTDQTLRIWDLRTGRELLILEGHAGEVSTIAYSPDGHQIASGGQDRTMRVWDTRTGREVLSVRGSGAVSAIVYSPDGKHVASGDGDGIVVIREASRQDPLILTECGTIQGINFSVCGGRVVASCANNSGLTGTKVRAWNSLTGKEIVPCSDPPPPLGHNRTLSRDGRLVAFVDHNTVRVQSQDEVNPLNRELRDLTRQSAWHEWRAQDAEEEQDDFAAAFHRKWLVNARIAESIQHAKMAEFHVKEQSWPQVIHHYTKARELRPDDPMFWYREAGALLQAGEWKRHREVCAAMMHQFGDTKNKSVANRVVYTCLTLSDPVDTEVLVRLARVAIETFPGNERVVGAALYRAGEYKDALKTF